MTFSITLLLSSGQFINTRTDIKSLTSHEVGCAGDSYSCHLGKHFWEKRLRECEQ